MGFKGFKSWGKGTLAKITQLILSLDILLHLAEVVSAYYEKAWTTFALTTFHTFVFICAIYLLGHNHDSHPSPSLSPNEENNSKINV